MTLSCSNECHMAWGDMKQYRSLKTVWPHIQHGPQTPSQTQVADLSLNIHTALSGNRSQRQSPRPWPLWSYRHKHGWPLSAAQAQMTPEPQVAAQPTVICMTEWLTLLRVRTTLSSIWLTQNEVDGIFGCFLPHSVKSRLFYYYLKQFFKFKYIWIVFFASSNSRANLDKRDKKREFLHVCISDLIFSIFALFDFNISTLKLKNKQNS